MTMSRGLGLDHHINAALILLNDRQRAASRLQQRSQLGFHKPALLVWIAHVAQRRSHVEHAARLALGQHVVTAQVNLRRFARGSQLLQVTVAEFSLFVFLVANGLCIRDPLWDSDGLGC